MVWREHDEVLRSAVEGRGGWLFKHTGDGVCAAFASAPEAVAAAVDAQRRLGLPVRMGVGTRHRRVTRQRLFRSGSQPRRPGDGRRAWRADPLVRVYGVAA